MEAFASPCKDDLEKATLYAAQVPLQTMKTSLGVYDILEAMIEKGNPNSVTDAGTGAPAVLGAVKGGYLNVLINTGGLKDREKARALREEAQALLDLATEREQVLWEKVRNKVNQ